MIMTHIMTSTEPVQVVKRVNDSAKKSPLKAVNPIIKKYTGHRQGKIKSKLKFPRVLHGGRSKDKPVKLQYKTILPKTNAGNIIILEPELLPCALNLLKRKKNEDETENGGDTCGEKISEQDMKLLDNVQSKDCSSSKFQKSKVLSLNKKKVKCLKNLEASVELLELSPSALKEKREQAYAENYLIRVQERLKDSDENLLNQFIDLICNFQVNRVSICDVFRRIKTMFSTHADLVEDFIPFLTAEQAVECGVFMDHLLLTTMSDFLGMIDVYFAKSPQQVKKIHSVLESLASKTNITTECVINTVLPLLKGNPVLNDYFLHLLPNTRPPDNFCSDYEEVEYSEINSDVSDEEDVVEMIHLPEVEDHYGGNLCPCKCHEESTSLPSQHCTSCSLKFINGKIFIQSGKLLRPAKVVFDDDHDVNYHRERLAPKLYPKRTKKRQRQSIFKDYLSPTKSCNLSSDEFKSDIEDEEKGRIKSAVMKSPRANRKKSVSPKHCHKSTSKSIFQDPADWDDKSTVGKLLDFSFDNDEEKCLTLPKVETDVKETRSSFFSFPVETPKSEDTGLPQSKILNLPRISVEDDDTPALDNSQFSFGETKPAVVTQDLPCLENERSRSPPVISIPDTGNSVFANSKPILSLLENLDDSKNGLMNLLNVEEESISESVKEEMKEEDLPWKIEEDRVILQTLQVEKNCEETFMKIGKNIPNRRVEDIKKRFAELMNMLYEMKAQNL